MSTITVTGRLTYDPELRFTPSGKAVLNLRIAENHSRRTANGSFEDAGTTFYNVTRWAPATDNSVEVEAIASGLHRGDLVLITGRLTTRGRAKDMSTTTVVSSDVHPRRSTSKRRAIRTSRTL